ncbi:MAG: hypothetical protein ACXACX_20790 [Candidatus Hodarchaeales archaeon]|jgi:hypothetical protein
MAKKIPGLAHEVNLAISGGTHNLDIILRGTVLVSTPIKSRSEQGIRKALDVLVSKAEISHQIQSSILDNLARSLYSESGYLDDMSAGTTGLGGDIQVPDHLITKIDAIYESVKRIEQRLARLEEKNP